MDLFTQLLNAAQSGTETWATNHQSLQDFFQQLCQNWLFLKPKNKKIPNWILTHFCMSFAADKSALSCSFLYMSVHVWALSSKARLTANSFTSRLSKVCVWYLMHFCLSQCVCLSQWRTGLSTQRRVYIVSDVLLCISLSQWRLGLSTQKHNVYHFSDTPH